MSDKKPRQTSDRGDESNESALSDISYLDFDVSINKDNQTNYTVDGALSSTNALNAASPIDFEEAINTPKSACIVTSVNDLGVFTAMLVTLGIDAIVMPSGAFGTVAFLHDLKDDAPNIAIKSLTDNFIGLEAILVEFRMGRLQSSVYVKGAKATEISPLLVVGNFSEAAEDALIGELDLFELVQKGNAKVDSNHALSTLPSNYIPKKYQKGYSHDSDLQNFNAFPTAAMPLEAAKETLEKFRRKMF